MKKKIDNGKVIKKGKCFYVDSLHYLIYEGYIYDLVDHFDIYAKSYSFTYIDGEPYFSYNRDVDWDFKYKVIKNADNTYSIWKWNRFGIKYWLPFWLTDKIHGSYIQMKKGIKNLLWYKTIKDWKPLEEVFTSDTFKDFIVKWRHDLSYIKEEGFSYEKMFEELEKEYQEYLDEEEQKKIKN